MLITCNGGLDAEAGQNSGLFAEGPWACLPELCSSHLQSKDNNARLIKLTSPSTRLLEGITVRVLLCQRAALPFTLHSLVRRFYCRHTNLSPIWRHREAAPLIWSFRWPHWAVQIDVGKAVGINCNDWPFYRLVYSLTPSRLQFLESLVTHFSTKCK